MAGGKGVEVKEEKEYDLDAQFSWIQAAIVIMCVIQMIVSILLAVDIKAEQEQLVRQIKSEIAKHHESK